MNEVSYKVRNEKKSCLVYTYVDGVLWCKHRIKCRYNGGDVEQFLTDNINNLNVSSITHYFVEIEKHFIDNNMYDLKGGILT